MKIPLELIISTLLIPSIVYSNDLTIQYREMMRTVQVKQKPTISSKTNMEKELRKKYQDLATQTVPKLPDGSIDMHSKEFKTLLENYAKERRHYKNNPISKDEKRIEVVKINNFIERIQKIKELTQGTFESSKEFDNRRSATIQALNKNIKLYIRQGSQEFSAGTVTMKHYDADREEMQLSLHWKKDIQILLPESKKLKTASLHIPRDQAKKLFATQDTHNFHIAIAYTQNNLHISKIFIYDKMIDVHPTEWYDNLIHSFFKS